MNDDRTSADYTAEDLDGARRICRLVARRLVGFEEDLVVVGGMVPTLLIGTPGPASGIQPHLGTKDVDLGLALRLVDDGRYKQVAERLRSAGFRRDANDAGNLVPQRWVLPGIRGVTLDFLVAPTPGKRRDPRVRRLEDDFGAYRIPGLDLAFEDRRRVSIGTPPLAEGVAEDTIHVCDAGAFVVLKSLALERRETPRPKDAYDLDWLLTAYEGGAQAVAEHLRRLPDCEAMRDGLAFLRQQYASMDARGPVSVARFHGDAANEALRADVFARTQQLLALLDDE